MRIWEKSIFAAALCAAPLFAATNFTMTPLIADQAGAAAVTDPNLVGTWGISASAASPFWVSNTANGTSTVYTANSATPAARSFPSRAHAASFAWRAFFNQTSLASNPVQGAAMKRIFDPSCAPCLAR